MNIHDIFSDSIVMGVVIPLMYLVKIYIKPSEEEARLISKLLISIGLIVINFARRWAEGHKMQLDKIHEEVILLRDRIKRSKIKLG